LGTEWRLATAAALQEAIVFDELDNSCAVSVYSTKKDDILELDVLLHYVRNTQRSTHDITTPHT
jgi:hypothetical protein